MAAAAAAAAAAKPPNIHIRLHGVDFHLNKDLMTSRSSKLSSLLLHSTSIDLTLSLPSISPDTFSLVAAFCHGDPPNLSPSTALPLAVAASVLDMTDDHHHPNNLLKLSISFLQSHILPSWNNILQSLLSSSSPSLLRHAHRLGILHAFLRSLSSAAAADPTLLTGSSPAAKRRLFTLDHPPEPIDICVLPLPLFDLAMSAMASSNSIPAEHIAQCAYRYMTRRLGEPVVAEGDHRRVVEAVERLLPAGDGAIHVSRLAHVLRSAVMYQASKSCRDALEERVAARLPEAAAADLCVPCCGYASETKYDMKCVRRMLDMFLGKERREMTEVEAVSAVLEEFLAEVAADEGLRLEELVPLLETAAGLAGGHDGVYRAIDVYLHAHGGMTEGEREEVCRVLDCRRMSGEAAGHAARNERMPVRVVAQVVFFEMRRIGEAVMEAGGAAEGSNGGEEEEEEKRVVVVPGGGGEDERRSVMKMSERVVELERENVRMRREIVAGGDGRGGKKEGKKRLWREMKGLFGCKGGGSMVDYDHLHGIRRKAKKQKVHPKLGGGGGGA